MALRLYLLLGYLVVASLSFWGVAHYIDNRGYQRCRAEWAAAVAAAKGKRDAELTVARLRGDALSAELAKRERQLSDLRGEYLTYANAITGNCPGDLGVLVQSASTAAGVPQTPGPSSGSSAPINPPGVAANLIGANIAENYSRCWDCISRYNALLDWHAATEKALK